MFIVALRQCRHAQTLPFLLLAAASGAATTATSWQQGVIFDHTAVPGGLLIRFDPALTPLPGNCAGASYNWMQIPEANKVMIAVTLMALAADNRSMTIYTKGINANNYCEVTQVDPAR